MYIDDNTVCNKVKMRVVNINSVNSEGHTMN